MLEQNKLISHTGVDKNSGQEGQSLVCSTSKQQDRPSINLSKESLSSSPESQPSKASTWSFLKTALLTSAPYSALGTSLMSVSMMLSQNSSIYSLLPQIAITIAYPILAYISVRNEYNQQLKPVGAEKETRELYKPSLFRRTQGLLLLGQSAFVLINTVANSLNGGSNLLIGLYDTGILGISALASFAAGKVVNEHTQTENTLVEKQNTFLNRLKIILLSSPGTWWIATDMLLGVRAVADLGIASTISNSKALGFFLVASVFTGLGIKSLYSQITNSSDTDINKQRIYSCVYGSLQLTAFSLFNFSLNNYVMGMSLLIYTASILTTARQIWLSSKK
jgi:hypothetical protein